ncbi:peptidase S8 and S53, subtilisin, kexin, sedolisin [Lysinibacillus fusiformis]|uniref:Peptidase S8 and S53, subtilisin, kexin, sedolisin n=1 Tax=Lysinibacillus fusiformis TaxID=28031 RepID=A0A2I0UVN5_9BACI|nr:peptidase S8 and S53, subtilisin, kexin, sedolisin [Lysinibacillus fusiformis]
MSRENNYLLGNGEKLTDSVKIKKSSGEKKPPYDFETAKEQVSSWLNTTIEDFDNLPDDACPDEQVSVVITMHPRYISKSEFPKDLLENIGVRAVGGRSRKIKPRAWGVKTHPEEALTDEIIVMGPKSKFYEWSNSISRWDLQVKGAESLTHLEGIRAFSSEEKVKNLPETDERFLFEFVLHEGNSLLNMNRFKRFVETHDGQVVEEKIRYVGDLAFVPIYASVENSRDLASYTYVRVLRAMPKLRTYMPSAGNYIGENDLFFSEKPVPSTDLRVAIFDGGIPENSPIRKWVNVIDPEGIGPAHEEGLEHGLGVTSALLFGSIDKNSLEELYPICEVDHIRVIDSNTDSSEDYESYDVLDRIIKTLRKAEEDGRPYQFVNLSLGPDIPIEDDEINRWTAELDSLLVGKNTFVTVAAGNSGCEDDVLKFNRIQPPSDAVNVLTVGACNTEGMVWEKADYSSVGPGRSPGIIKPDGVVFGGSDEDEFVILTNDSNNPLMGTSGTSFAAPYLLRSSIAVSAQLNINNPLLNKALLVHRAERNEKLHKIEEVGWGRFETDFSKLITCDDDEAIVIYQGELNPREHLRAYVPLPEEALIGKVSITSTLVISPEIDPSYPNVYTKAGLEVTFRPNTERFGVNKKDGTINRHPKTRAFFNCKNVFGNAELELREDGHKWEPCLKASQTFLAGSLLNPVFDIYYHNREEGQALRIPKPIPYALVISIKAPKVPDLYNRVVRTYSNILVPLKPQLRIQLNG